MGKLTEKKNRIIYRIALLVMGFLYQLPQLMVDGIPLYPYEDGLFHLSRIMGMSNVWHSPVNFLHFHHNGLMVNIFYPWLTMYPAYLLFRILGSYIAAYKAYYLLLTVVTLFLAYDVMHNISGNRLSAFCFAVLYTFSLYRFENLFHRSALGEVTAITLWLLVFAGLYHIYFGDWRRWGFLTAGMALLAYTHNLSLLIAALVTGLVFLLSVWFWDNRWQRIRALFFAGAVAVVLSLGSLLPMLQMFSSDQLQIPGGTGLSLLRSAPDLKTMFVKMLRNDTSGQTVGLIIFVALCVLCVFYLADAVKKTHRAGNRGMNLFALAGVLVMFSVSQLMPWEWIGDHSFLRQLQFVWRLNTCPTLFILAAFAYYLPKMIPSRKAAVLIPVVICIAAVGIHYRTFLVLLRIDHTRIFEEAVVSGEAASMDYAPLRAKQYRDETHLPYLDGVLISEDNSAWVPFEAAPSFSADGSVYTLILDIPASAEEFVTVDIPVFRYSNQQCTVNGELIQTSLSERGSSLMTLVPGQVNEIRIFYQYTTLANLAHILSGAAAVLWGLLSVIKKRKTAYS